jgi:hypothetical protein
MYYLLSFRSVLSCEESFIVILSKQRIIPLDAKNLVIRSLAILYALDDKTEKL